MSITTNNEGAGMLRVFCVMTFLIGIALQNASAQQQTDQVSSWKTWVSDQLTDIDKEIKAYEQNIGKIIPARPDVTKEYCDHQYQGMINRGHAQIGMLNEEVKVWNSTDGQERKQRILRMVAEYNEFAKNSEQILDAARLICPLPLPLPIPRQASP